MDKSIEDAIEPAVDAADGPEHNLTQMSSEAPLVGASSHCTDAGLLPLEAQ